VTSGQEREGDVARLVRTYLDHLTVERGLAKNTLSSYRRDLRRYLEFLAHHRRDDLSQVTEEDVAAFLAALRLGDSEHPPLSASSAGRTIVAVRGFHRFAVREGNVDADTAGAIRPPTPARRLPKAIAVEDVERLLEAAGAEGTPRAQRDRALLEVLYGTGARISEAVGLDVDDVDLDAGMVRLFGKGSKDRMVPLGSYAKAALELYIAGGEAGSRCRSVVISARSRFTRRGVPQCQGWSVVAAERVDRSAHRGNARWPQSGDIPTHTPAFVRHASPGRRSGRSCRPGIARSCIGDHDADLHDGDRRATARGVRISASASSRMTIF
jgi:site-specific recombinase XerD